MAKALDPSFIDDVIARTRLSELVGEHVPLKRRGREYVGLCPFHSEKTPSFTVSEDRGFYHCFGCGANGDAITWVRHWHGLDFRGAVSELAVRAGLQTGEDGQKRPLVRPMARQNTEDRQRERVERIAWARRIWREARAIKGTAGEAYLRSRGIATGLRPALLMPPTLRFHEGLGHHETGTRWPVMVAGILSGDRKFCGIHRTYLSPDGAGKAPVSPAKLMAGEMWGGAIRLAQAGPVLAVAEGIETGLSVLQAGRLPVWVTGSLGNMAAIALPPIVREVVLCVDADSRDPAQFERAVDKAVAFHAGQGRAVKIARPPQGMDFNDVLQRGAA